MFTLSTKIQKEPAAFHHGNLAEALVDAAEELVEREGLAAVSLREAARRAGVSHAAPYRHFSSRDALLAAVASRGFISLRDAFENAASMPGSFLLAVGQTYVRFALANPGLFRLMFGSGLDRRLYPEMAAAADSAFGVLLRATTERGSNAPEDAALGAWALAHGLAQLAAEHQFSDEQQEDAKSGKLLERISKVYGLQ